MPRIYLRNGRRPRSPANPAQAPGRPVAQGPSRASLGNARQRACVRWLRSTPRKESDERLRHRGAVLNVDPVSRRLLRDLGIREAPVVSSGSRRSAIVVRLGRAIGWHCPRPMLRSMGVRARTGRRAQLVMSRWRSERIRVAYLRWKLCTGRLPYANAPRIYGAPGSGGWCDACDQLLEPTQLVMSIPWPSEKTFAHLHADCFMLWERERREQH